MKNVTLSTFSLRVKTHKNRKVEYYALDEIPMRRKQSGRVIYRSLLDLLIEYLRQLKRQPAVDGARQCMLTASNITTSDCSVSTFLEMGEFGVQNDLLHVKKREVTHKRTIDDAEMVPYYFLAAIPQDKKRGIVAFQMEGESGIKGYFEQCFGEFLKKRCNDCELELERLVPKRLMNQYLKVGRVTSLRFVHLKVPRTIEQAYMLKDLADDATVELHVKAKRGSAIMLKDNIKGIMEKYKDGQEFVQIRGFEYDTVKVDFKMGETSRTIDLGTPNTFRAGYNVTDRVVIISGHPTFESIDRTGREIVREILQSFRMAAKGV
jgi:hypothetical protein